MPNGLGLRKIASTADQGLMQDLIIEIPIAAEKVKVVFGCVLGAKRKVSFPIDFAEYKSSTREWKPCFNGMSIGTTPESELMIISQIACLTARLALG